MIKANLKEVFDYLNSDQILVISIKIKGVVFTSEQLKLLHDHLVKDKSIFNCIELDLKYYLSRRKALIVVLEEDFYDRLSYDFTDLKKYENKAALRFEIRNKEKNVLDTPQKVHPKNPCKYFNGKDMAYKKRHYKDAISEILKTPFHFFEVKEAEETLKETYTKMISDDC
ncbi:hypothetical protein FVB9288_02273 [Flavobacterium sp. CECT 9288]|uniref:hypothetical protein n=1 Tax=Flavobacterium sp. CECT 9288 TaxID=2845819 RepID=UPI001E3E11A7|nr:hypothetical protein [Flavobacterium sp. CECT 9288]CAH0336567.1 hypothetical protein FVB9288_02273 [Flavobacterium sp. CECT 9288]